MSLPHSLFLVIFGASGDLTRIGIPGMLLQIFGGYALLKAIAKR